MKTRKVPGNTTFYDGRLLLEKVKDQAREISELRTFLTELRELVVVYPCECDVNRGFNCVRCIVKDAIEDKLEGSGG